MNGTLGLTGGTARVDDESNVILGRPINMRERIRFQQIFVILNFDDFGEFSTDFRNI